MDLLISSFHNLSHLLLYYIIPVIIVLGIMIFFHELGHFLAAKYFNVKVLKFALGFGPKIAGRNFGETEYSIRYFPVGGFVKMLGENETEDEKGSISEEDEKRSFDKQHPIKRIAIVAAGPVFNLVLALVLFLGLYFIAGDYIIVPEIGKVTENSPAQRAGLKEGDVIVSVLDREIKSWDDLRGAIKDSSGIRVPMVILRQDDLIPMSVVPEESVTKNEFGEDESAAFIGIAASGKIENIKFGPLEAISRSFLDTWKYIKLTCLVVVKLFEGVVPIKTIGGPIMVGQITGQIAQQNIGSLIPFMAVISINLGILNLFPIPILDGGVILFLLFELVLGRPVSARKREMAQKVGLSLLLLLSLFVFYNDFLRLFQ